MSKVGRNDPCPCGSGKKYKQCCMNTAAAIAITSGTQPQSIAEIAQLVDKHIRAGNWEKAKPLLHKLLKISPQNPDFLHGMSVVFNGLGEYAEATKWLLKAINERPDNADYYFMLGILWGNSGQFDKASTAYEQAIEQRPTFAEAHANLGDALRKMSRFDEAIESYKKAILLMPDAGQIYCKMGLSLQSIGRMIDALACFDTALELDPGLVMAASDGLLASLYYHGYTAQQVFDRHISFAQRFEEPLKPGRILHRNERSTDRRLRMGYVSADLRNHSVANFAEPIITRHDKSRFETFIYYNNGYCDAVTARFQATADHWRSCASWSDERLADAIRADQIDILIDLSGHTDGNRLLTFARKPAPVQVTWIGYPGTTGLSAMDYRITDENIDPPGVSDALNTERLLRLPANFTFQPPEKSPPVVPLPALSSSVFTLACMSNMAKLNEVVIATWSRILLALPKAHMLIGNAGNKSTQEWLLGLFAQYGIGAERLSLHAKVDLAKIMKLSSSIDLSLDTFPYNGATASMFSLWMGVPVVTLCGDRTAARLGTAVMSRFDLPQFIAHDEQEYVDIVLRWAADLPALNALRQSLRGRMEGIQDDSGKYKLAFEQAMIDIWERWCQTSPVS